MAVAGRGAARGRPAYNGAGSTTPGRLVRHVNPFAAATLLLSALLAGGLALFLLWPDPSRAADLAPLDCAPAAETSPAAGGTSFRRFTLVAAPASVTPRAGLTLPVWAFNGSVPGPELRARVGDRVEVTVCNGLPTPVAVHWHGYPVPNAMDGVPGLTQDAIPPGGRFTYAFDATSPGTYWYHSHQASTLQVDRGLFGALVVEPRQTPPAEAVDRDLTLVLADRQGLGAGPADLSEVESVRQALRQAVGLAPIAPPTLNGRAYEAAEPLTLRAGERVRLRLVHAGTDRHILQLGGHRYRLVATDGQPVHAASETTDLLPLYPGQRADIIFTADNPGAWTLRLRDGLGPAVPLLPIRYEGEAAGRGTADAAWGRDAKLLDLATYGAPVPPNSAPAPGRDDLRSLQGAAFTHRITLDMRKPSELYTLTASSTLCSVGDSGLVDPSWAPSGAAHDHLRPQIALRPGDLVELTLANRTTTGELHPMHLHGTAFQVLSVNGQPYRGAPIWRDTVNVGPRETVVVAFRADNPGAWMLHCHVLRHATQQLGTVLLIGDVKLEYSPGGPAGNIPE